MVSLKRSRGHIQDLISGRPRLNSLEDGWHVRNAAEVQDIAAFADWVTPSLYFGIAGSRLGGKILIPSDKLLPGDTYRYDENIIKEVIERMPKIWRSIRGWQRVSGIRTPYRERSLPPASLFLYDIDLIHVPFSSDVASSYETTIGPHSGTRIDILTISHDALRRHEGFFRAAFLNSNALPFANNTRQ